MNQDRISGSWQPILWFLKISVSWHRIQYFHASYIQLQLKSLGSKIIKIIQCLLVCTCQTNERHYIFRQIVRIILVRLSYFLSQGPCKVRIYFRLTVETIVAQRTKVYNSKVMVLLWSPRLSHCNNLTSMSLWTQYYTYCDNFQKLSFVCQEFNIIWWYCYLFYQIYL